MSLSNRALLFAVLLLVVHFGERAVDAYLSILPPLPPKQDLAKLPLAFDEWRGEDVEITDDILENLGAAAVVNRTYRNDRREAVGLNVAVFTGLLTGIPHTPLDCYTRAGWELKSARTVQLQPEKGRTADIALYVFEKRSETAMVGYWVHLAKNTVTDNDGVRRVHRSLRGARLPLTKKVLMHTPIDTLERSEARLLSLALPVFKAVDAFE